MAPVRNGRVWALCVSLVACSAPVTDSELRTAERAERDGDHARALRLYHSFNQRCAQADRERMTSARRQQCVDGYLARAELLEHTGQKSAAIEAYLGAGAALPWDRASAAAGVYRAGRIYLQTGREVEGYKLLWHTITEYPDEHHARDALHVIIRDGRRRNSTQLYQVLGSLLQPLADSLLADNLLYAMADLAEREFGDTQSALAHHDKLSLDYPDSTMRDDALWHGARLARQLGDGRGAVERLRKLLATREVSIFPGSYLSVWLDNGQLELGRILRDDLREYRAALRAFRELPELYPDSILVDDAVWETALTYQAMNDAARACRTLATLNRRWPDSKYGLDKGPALARELGCPAAQ